MLVEPEEWRAATYRTQESIQFDGGIWHLPVNTVRLQARGWSNRKDECSLLGDRLHSTLLPQLSAFSVKHDSNTNPEIVLRAIKQSRRVVIELNHSHIKSIACTDV